MTLNFQNKGFSEFFSDFWLRHTFFRVNCAETVEDGAGKPAYDIFSIERTFLRI